MSPLCEPYAENHRFEMGFKTFNNLINYVFDKSWNMRPGAGNWLNGGKISNLISSDVTNIGWSGHSFVYVPVRIFLFEK